jgi:hypothetical protein
MNSKLLIKPGVLFFFLIVLTGCSTIIPFKPNYMDSEFSPSEIEEITVLPVVDIRKDKSLKIAYQKIGTYEFKYFFPRMGYQVKLSDNFGKIANITEDDIARQDVDFIKNLGPDNAQWVFLVTLDDLATRKTLGIASVAECSGILYDKDPGKEVWRHKATHQYGQGGIAGMMMGGTVREESLRACVDDLLAQFPSKNGKKWYGLHNGLWGKTKTMYKTLR